MEKSKKIILVGPGGSGKNYMAEKFEKRGYVRCVTTTSRAPRANEKNGVDYYFEDREFFEKNRHHFYEIDEFNGWLYGTLNEDFGEADLVLMTPRGVKNLQPWDRSSSVVIYLNPPKDVIKERLLARKDADSAERRMKTDEEDFKDFTDYDIMITNPDF
jgi:guanylate kinase